jgi:hypothetical protein
LVGAVVLEPFEDVLAPGAGLLGRVGEDLEGLDALAAGLGGAGRGGGVEHGLEDGRVLRTVGAWRNWRAMSTALTVATALMQRSVAVAVSA